MTIPGFFIFPALLDTESKIFSSPCEALIYFNFHNFHFFRDFTNSPPQAICRTNRKHFRDPFLQPSLNGSFVEMTIPKKPGSPLQKYCLTETGRIAHRINRGGE
ncbi:MAG: Fic family protein [Chlorobium sp.]